MRSPCLWLLCAGAPVAAVRAFLLLPAVHPSPALRLPLLRVQQHRRLSDFTDCNEDAADGVPVCTE